MGVPRAKKVLVDRCSLEETNPCLFYGLGLAVEMTKPEVGLAGSDRVLSMDCLDVRSVVAVALFRL